MSCLCFFPFDVSDGRCGIIVSVPDHCLPFNFFKKSVSLLKYIILSYTFFS